MDTQDINYDTIVNTMYPYYLEREIQKREIAKKLLSDRNFKELKNFVHYYNTKCISIPLQSEKLNDAIKELQEFNLPINAETPILYSYLSEETNEPIIVIEYYLYTISNKNICKELATSWSKASAWEIIHQPNGKDAKQALEIIKNL